MPVNEWTQVVLKYITILLKNLCGNMKTVYDLVFCNAALTKQTVFYHVYVGNSARDLRALAFVRSIAKAPDFFFARHSIDCLLYTSDAADELDGGGVGGGRGS